MNALLDTHIILWWLSDDDKLDTRYREIIGSPENICFVSAASVWEINIKRKLGKLGIPGDFIQELQREGFKELAVTWVHTSCIYTLPPIHRDPFDRLLIAQSKVDSLVLLSVDEAIKKYDVDVV